MLAVSPATVDRPLKAAGRLDRRKFSPSKKGTGFVQPEQPHQPWHADVSYINIDGTLYYLTSVLDGASRSLVHWELRDAMTEQDVEVILQRALEAHPQVKPPIITDNGPQFIARDFQQFSRLISGTTRTNAHRAPPMSLPQTGRASSASDDRYISPARPKQWHVNPILRKLVTIES